jgi:adenylylsulfate kinase
MGTVLWFTGLSGSGKTTIADALERALIDDKNKVAILDGDVVRTTLHKNLGFSREDIRENNRLIAELAKEKQKENDFVLVPIISPYREDREIARRMIGEGFVEVYINCSLDECRKRDPKGLYKKVDKGEIKNFIGVAESNPYEAPTNPDVELRTGECTAEECVQDILRFLKN